MYFEEKCVCFREYVNPISYPLSIRCSLLFCCSYSSERSPCHYQLATRAYIRKLFPEKNRSLVHRRYLIGWFSSVFGVKVWVSEPFTPPPCVKGWGCRKYYRQINCWGTLNGADSIMVRGDKWVTGMLFCVKRRYTVCEGLVNAVWTLWMLWMVQPFTPEINENQWKNGFLWRREHFFGSEKYV